MVATNKNIKVTDETKEKLNKLKQHHRETYEDIIERLIKEFNSKQKPIG